MLKFIVAFMGIVCLSNTLLAQGKLSKSDMVKLDFEILAEKKVKVQSKDAGCMPAYHQLLKDADKALRYQPVSVMDKTEFPKSGNKHDYMSIGPYWWPDPSKADGVPYIRKDGEVNPEVANYPDKENLGKVCENVYTLALAYYFSDDDKYAKHAATLLEVWFLDSATAMNPNLSYGQSVKGVTNGRAEGLIDTRHLVFILDAVELLKKSPGWTMGHQQNLKKWFADFLNWMVTSDIGKDEMNAKNNHGVWYDAQTLSFALFTDDMEHARKIVERATVRLDTELDNNGSFPLEMKRTTSMNYTAFILNAYIIIAELSEKTGTDFWVLKTTSGKSLQSAFNFLLPYITKQKPWVGNQIKEFNYLNGFPILLRGSTKFNCNRCMEDIKNIAPDKYQKLLLQLL
jgi:hypothetical protein